MAFIILITLIATMTVLAPLVWMFGREPRIVSTCAPNCRCHGNVHN